jgi:hypothetical protein
MGAVLTVLLIATALWAWFCILWLVPRNLRSLFRYRLWRLRDGLATEIRAENFDEVREPRHLLDSVECFIEMAEELTPLRISLLILSARPAYVFDKETEDTYALSLAGLSRHDKDLLGRYVAEFNDAVTKHVFFGSPSGWLACIPFSPFFVAAKVMSLWQRRESDLAYDVRRRTTAASLTAIASSHIHDSAHQPLSTYVN